MNDNVVIRSSREKIELGIKGEDLAESFLKEIGYRILKRNYRIGHSDIDILAKDESTLVFIEVRTKSMEDRGMPEDTLTAKKLRRMKKTAELYMAFNHYEGSARLDAVCIVLDKTGRIRHFKHYMGVGS